MFKINKILILFITIVLTMFVGIWETMHSDFIRNKVLVLANKYTERKMGISIKVEEFDFNLFPISVAMKGFSLVKEDAFDTYFSQVGLEFSLYDSLKTKFTIDKVIISDGYLEYSPPPTEETGSSGDVNWKTSVKKVIKTIVKKSQSLPIGFNYIILKDFSTNIKQTPITIKYMDLSVTNKSIVTNLKLQNIDTSKWIDANKSIDQVDLSVWISQDVVEIKSIKIKDEFNQMDFRGKINNYLSGEIETDLQGKVISDISVINEYVDLSKIGKIEKGQIDLRFNTKGSLEDLETKINLKVNNLESQFVNASNVHTKAILNQNEIRINSFELRDNQQYMSLTKPFQLLDLKTKKFVEENIFVRAKKVKLNNALRYLGDNLKVLKGDVTGDVEFMLRENSFDFLAKKGTIVENLKLVIKESNIIDIPQLDLEDEALFGVDRGNFKMSLTGAINKKVFKATGLISDKSLSFKVIDGEIDLGDWGPIANLEMKGAGIFSFFTEKKNNQINLIIDSRLNNFDLMGYKLEEVNSKTIINVTKNELFVDIVEAKKGKLTAVGNLVLDLKKMEIDSNVDLETPNIKDLRDVLFPLLGKVDVLPGKIWGNWKASTQVSGKLTPKGLIVRSSVIGKNNFIFDESFSSIKFDLLIKNEILSFQNIDITKLKGKAFGSFDLDLVSTQFKYDVQIKDLPLYEITNYTKLPFALNSLVNGKFEKTRFDNKLMSGLIRFEKSKIENRSVEDSQLSFNQVEDVINLKMNLLGEQVVSDVQFDLSKKMNSHLKFRLNSEKVDELLGITKLVDINDLSLKGSLNMIIDSRFDKWSFLKGNHNLNIQELYLNKEDFNMHYQSPQDNIIINNGQVEKWDLNYLGTDFSITSEVSGNFLNNYVIESRFKLNAKIFEVFNTIIGKASGVARGKISVDKNFDASDLKILVFSNNLRFDSPLLPVDVENASFEVNYSNELLLIEKFNAQLNKGSVDLSGRVILKDLYPDVNLKYKLNSAYLPIKNKSELVLSGDGVVIGNRFPYNASGNLILKKLNIRNEFAEFIESDSVAFKKDYDYLPESKNKYANRYVNFNFNLNIPNTIQIKNSLVSLQMGGDLVLSGGESNMNLLGDLNLSPGFNSATFKNNEFVFKKLSISFLESRKIHNPDLDVHVTSNIEKYKVNAKVLGPVNNFNVDLSAEPFLSKESILSLIAFGYTEDLTTNLNDKEKEAMTQAGVGSILFDSFKINETLKDELGLEVNLGSEITKEEGSYLAGRASGDTGVGKVKSATTVEVRKSITEEMNLSVSSTLGGSIGQRQSMNLNYNINEKVSLEGVYESRSTTEGQSINTGNSLGADVKFKWSFK